MTDGRASGASGERFRLALTGERVAPPVTGISFLDPRLLPGEGSADAALAERLVRTCAEARLDFAFVPSWEPWSLEALSSLGSAGVVTAWVVPGVLAPVLETTGAVEALRSIAVAPDAMEHAFDDAVACALASARVGLEAGAAAVVVADDMAGAQGPIVDPAFLGEYVFPRLARVAGLAREAGLPAILHTDGDVRSLAPLAVRAGFVAVHGDAGGPSNVERGLAALRAAGLAFIGGVPTPELSGASRTDLRRWRGRAVASGGLLIADDGGITTAAEAEALLAILGEAGADRG